MKNMTAKPARSLAHLLSVDDSCVIVLLKLMYLNTCRHQFDQHHYHQPQATRHRASTSMYSLTFRVRVKTPPAVWTKWNGLVADNVAHAAGASILSPARGVFAGMRSVCGGPCGLPLGSATHFECCHSNGTRAPIANPANCAQLEGIPYHSPKLHPRLCNTVGVPPRTDTQTHTDRHTDSRDHNTFRVVYDSREM